MGVVNLTGGESWWIWGFWLVSAGCYATMAWARTAARTSADQRGVRHHEPLSRTASLDLRWEDVVDIRPNTAARWADHVIVETADGKRHRLQLVPPADVDELRALWSS